MSSNWYVIQTYSGQESRIATDIENSINTKFEAFTNDKKIRKLLSDSIINVKSPQREVVSVKNGKKSVSVRKDFPCYVLVEMTLNEESKSFVQHITGVLGFVGGVRNPHTVKESEIERILGRETMHDSIVEATEVPFMVDDQVKITAGPFKGFNGEIKKVNPEKGKAIVDVMVFGRATPVEVDFSQIESVS
ncbi:MAG: transcription termination/antitermination protein NusG [Chitinispirillales bacterium]|jgi:transcriptional antiterminator NusG|nr:transcription termination/antitermination protein NusG [Chitinispirillales bacterium]